MMSLSFVEVVAWPPPQTFKLFTPALPLHPAPHLVQLTYTHSSCQWSPFNNWPICFVGGLPGHVTRLCCHCIPSYHLPALNLIHMFHCIHRPSHLGTPARHFHTQTAALLLSAARCRFNAVHFCYCIVAHLHQDLHLNNAALVPLISPSLTMWYPKVLFFLMTLNPMRLQILLNLPS